jgi:galactoside O-acetyltransferase
MLAFVDRAQSRWSRWRLAHQPGVSVAPDARIAGERVTLAAGCVLRVGAGSVVEATIDFEKEGAVVVIGSGTFVGASTFKCAARIEIGDDVEIAWNCSIVDHDWESLVFEERHVDTRGWYSARKDWSHVSIAPVRIGNRVLIGFNTVILKGVTIGDGAVVGVGSIVTKDVAPYTVVAGVPARAIRTLDRP